MLQLHVQSEGFLFNIKKIVYIGILKYSQDQVTVYFSLSEKWLSKEYNLAYKQKKYGTCCFEDIRS